MIYTIPEQNINRVVKKLEALNRRASKLGVDPIKYSTSKPYEKILPDDGEGVGKDHIYMAVDLDMGNSIVSMSGWSFLAIIEHAKTGNIIFKKLYDVEIPEEYRISSEYCEHCKTKRYRKYTYLVYNREENKIYQVGSTCINNYLGFDASFMVAHATLLDKLDSMSKDRKSAGARGEVIENLSIFMSKVIVLIDKFGYISAKKAQEDDNGQVPTGREAWNLDEKQIERLELVDIIKSNKAKETLDKVKAFVELMENTNDYTYNIKNLVKRGYVTQKTANLAASIVGVYYMNLEKSLKDEAARKHTENSNWIGEIKERIEIEMILTSHRTYNGNYGLGNIYTFTTSEGNIVVWFTNSRIDMEIGKSYEGKVTIVNYTEFNGTKQTVVNRCKLKSI